MVYRLSCLERPGDVPGRFVSVTNLIVLLFDGWAGISGLAIGEQSRSREEVDPIALYKLNTHYDIENRENT